MRKGLLLLVFAALLSLPSFAQWSIGLSGGVAYNHYHYDPQYMEGMHYGGHSGGICDVYLYYNFNNSISLIGGALLQQRGYNLDVRHHDSVTINKYRRDDFYICFPLMVEFSFGQSKWQGFVDAGAYAGYWLKSRHRTKMYFSYLNHQYDELNWYTKMEFSADRDQRFEFGIIGGLGTKYNISNHFTLFAAIRCYQAFTPQQKNYQTKFFPSWNTVLTAQLGCMYNFKSK